MAERRDLSTAERSRRGEMEEKALSNDFRGHGRKGKKKCSFIIIVMGFGK